MRQQHQWVTDDGDDGEVAVVLAGYRAWGLGDIDRAVAALHPDVEWIEPDEFPHGGRYQGPAAVAAVADGDDDDGEGGVVVIVHHVAGRLLDGTGQDVTVADVHTLRDGYVIRMQAYADPSQALA